MTLPLLSDGRNMAYELTTVLLVLIPLGIWLYLRHWWSILNTWQKRGIPSLPGTLPYGSNKVFSREKEFQGYPMQEMYNKFPNEPYFGFYYGSVPFIMLREPETIRIVLAKEFSHFRDRQGQKMHENDYLSQHLFNLEGDTWRALRIRMSPVFTSGKLKAMFPLFVKCAAGLNTLLLSRVEKAIDIKDISARFSTDVICSCAFGLEVDSLNNEDTPFRKIGKNFVKLDFSYFIKLKMALMRYIPLFADLSLPRFTPKEVEDFMIKAITDTVNHREKTGQTRNDFIDLLMQLKNKGILNEELPDDEEYKKNFEPVELTMELMAAQCFVFFIAGFETSSSVQSFCLYELALNNDIQERLYKEIETVIEKHREITYQAIQEMEYLDMVVSETMRKYPTLINLNRRCTKPFTMPNGHRIEKGDRIFIPTWAIHHDPENFPDPEKFDPERFSPSNRHTIHPFAYLPFGEGPRICIGNRFGLLQTKMGIITVIRKFRVERCSETTMPLEFAGEVTVLIRTKGPIILKVTKRE